MVEWCVEAEEKILRTTNISTAENGKTRKNERTEQAIALNWFVYVSIWFCFSFYFHNDLSSHFQVAG